MAIVKFDYIESQADADELIEEFGQVGAIRRSAVIGGSPADPEPGVTTTTDYPCTLVVLPIDLQNTGRDIGGTLVKATDKQILVSVVGLPITPTTTDLVLADGAFVADVYEGGTSYTVMRNNTLAPSGAPVFHDIIGSV